MNDLIKINYDSEQPTVLGRDLHEALEVKTAYKNYICPICQKQTGKVKNIQITA